MTRDPTEERAEALARQAADRAAMLALADAEKATVLAVNRAVRDANVDRDLLAHSEHLEQINGSQRDMAADLADVNRSLSQIKQTFREQLIVQEALTKAITAQRGSALSRKQVWIATLATIAAYGSLIGILFSHVH